MRLFVVLFILFLSSCSTKLYVEKSGKWVPYTPERRAPLTISVEREDNEDTLLDSVDFLSDCRVEADGRLTKFYRCRYQDPKAVMDVINRNKSKKGTVYLNAATNTLVITDSKDGLLRIAEALVRLDIPSPQVRIKVRVVELTRSDQLEYGFEYTQDRSGKTGVIRRMEGTFDPKNYLDSLKPGAHPFQGTTVTITGGGKRRGNIDLIVMAFRELGDASVNACPDLVVIQGKQAKITAGEDVPFITSSVTGSTVNYSTQFKPVGVTLIVRPELVNYDGVRLYVKAEVSSVTGWTDPSLIGGVSNPIVSKRTAETTIYAKDHSIFIFGGLITKRRMLIRRSVPLLGDIPLLGFLFSSTRYENNYSLLNFLLEIEIVSPVKEKRIPKSSSSLQKKSKEEK